MKYTNIKKLLIKFMGGGLVNFPTRFLRWVKIEGDTEGDDGGGDSGGGGGEEGNSNIFFSPLAIQPSYYCMIDEDNPTIHEIQDIANTISTNYSEDKELYLFYSKEQLMNLGISENILNNIQQVTYPEFIEDLESDCSKCHKDDENLNNIIYNNYIVNYVTFSNYAIVCERVTIMDRMDNGIYKFGDDIYLIVNVAPGGGDVPIG